MINHEIHEGNQEKQNQKILNKALTLVNIPLWSRDFSPVDKKIKK